MIWAGPYKHVFGLQLAGVQEAEHTCRGHSCTISTNHRHKFMMSSDCRLQLLSTTSQYLQRLYSRFQHICHVFHLTFPSVAKGTFCIIQATQSSCLLVINHRIDMAVPCCRDHPFPCGLRNIPVITIVLQCMQRHHDVCNRYVSQT